MDEGYTINAVISAAHNGYAGGSSILDSGGKYFCPLYCYPTQIISQAIGQNAVAYRLLAAIFGVIFILLAFFITKIIFKNNAAALLTAFFVSFSYWQIAWSRQARWYTMLEVFFWLAFLFFYLFLNTCHCEPLAKQPRAALSASGGAYGRCLFPTNLSVKKYSYLALSIIFTILAILTSNLAYVLPLIFFIILLIDKPFRQWFKHKKFLIFSFSFLIVFFAFVEYGLGMHFIGHAIKNISFHYELPYYLSFYLRNYWLLILIAIYGYFSAEKEQKKKMAMLAIPFIIYLIFLSFFTDIVHYRYLFHTSLFIYMLAAVAISPLLFKEGQGVVKIPLLGGVPSPARRPALSPVEGGGFILLIIIIFFLSGEGVIFPKNFYFLEADNPTQLNRPYYAYTPQPNFNAAYAAIKNNLKPDEIIISSHPQFTKIFLNQPGYWIKYNYLGMEDTPNTLFLSSRAPGEGSASSSLSSRAPGEGSVPYYKEYYVGAEVINNLDDLKKITAQKHGYIIFDYQSTDSRIDPQIINYIQTNLQLFFYNKINSYSQIWVYKF
jgi:hypothetical protein